MIELIIFGVVNFIAAVFSGASGGAGAIVSAPLMVALGLSPAQAIATMKFGGLGISIGALGRFSKEQLTDRRTVIIFSIIGAIAAVIGSLTLNHFSDNTEQLQKLMGLAILVVAIPLLYLKDAGLKPQPRARWVKIACLPLLFLGVFMQVALGSGIGSLQMVLLISGYGMTALVASATRRAMQLVVSIVALAIFLATDLIDYQFGAVAFFSALTGGYIGAHIALKKGNKFVLNVFALFSALLALQLLLS